MNEAGIDDRRFYDLRHSYAVAALRCGDDGKTVQENLGHHTAAFMLDQYGHVTEAMKREVRSVWRTSLIALSNKAICKGESKGYYDYIIQIEKALQSHL